MSDCVERERSAVRRPSRVSRLSAVKPQIRPWLGCIGDGMVTKSERLTQGDLAGSAEAVGRRKKERRTMTRQKSERRVEPEGRRKAVESRAVERAGGGKATPVRQTSGQLELPLGAAEVRRPEGLRSDGEAGMGGPMPATCAVPQPSVKEETVQSATMEQVCEVLRGAFQKVASNRGAAGPDGESIEEVRKHLPELLPKLKEALQQGNYEPGEIRRVWIPKSGGGQRGLGIPNVIDRVVSEAVRQVLEPVYEPTFHASSHGFRPNRSCHTAIAQAQEHIAAGYEWVVDIDLEKFFDRVNHQRLMARLAQRVSDRRLLVLVGRMLKARVVMPEGVVVSPTEGVPQGGPLSPLLSNVVLDELDHELSRRGHRFVRYADDANIYVQSERAGQRVMASVTQFIEKRLRLKVNAAKSAVARPEERHFLGFRMRREPFDGSVEVLLSKRSKERIDTRIRELTPRAWGNTLRACIHGLNVYLRGWMGFFHICTDGVRRMLESLDGHIRRRLRAIQVKHWKRNRSIVQNLVRLGVSKKLAWKTVYTGRKSVWAQSHTPAMHRGLRNEYFSERGLVSLAEEWSRHNPPLVAPEAAQAVPG